MTTMLRAGRILSSDENNSVKQEQTTNVNIKVQTNPKQDSSATNPPNHISSQPSYVGGVNFIQQDVDAAALYPSVHPINNTSTTANTEELIADLVVKNKFLTLLLSAYQNNPIRINNYVIVNHKLLIEMIKLLTNAERVDLILSDDISVNCSCGRSLLPPSVGGSSCCADADHDDLIYISKILVTKDDSTTELKYGYNNVSSEFVKFGISLKITCA